MTPSKLDLDRSRLTPEELRIVTPNALGPTWQKDAFGNWLIPEHSLGWQIAAWCADYLRGPDGGPWMFTDEQFRFLLWWYAIDEDGRWAYRTGVLQRCKGWGKDPLLAVICIVEFVGPCRFSHWEGGEPVAIGNDDAWVQIFGTSMDQCVNTMAALPRIISDRLKREYDIEPGAVLWRAMGKTRRLEAKTSNHRTAEGNRTSFAVLNEALALDTPIPTPTGWVNMGDLRDGDTIYGSDGKPTTVTKAHEVQHGRDSYRVTFDDGNSVVASDGHWWKVRTHKNRRGTLHQMTTAEMYERGGTYYLPESFSNLETAEADLPIDPYFLGLWLGDGSTHSSVIATDEQDAEELLGILRGIEPNAHMRDPNHIGMSQGNVRKPGSMQERLRKNGLLGNKHIPQEYLRASFEQRLALLQGLMDSDGHVRRNGHARFANTDQDLLEQVEELLVSLGYHVKKAKFQVRTGDRAHWAPLGQISFKAVSSVNPFRLSRKASQVAGESSTTRSRLRAIVSIEQMESVPVRCISVSAEDKLFLAGRGMHATRNTHHWVSGNGGHDLYLTIDGNVTKIPNSRHMAITNAFLPGEDSVGERLRKSADLIAEGKAVQSKFMYDSLEAQPDAPLSGHLLPYVLDAVRGDAKWLDIEATMDSIASPHIAPSRSRRMYLNQIIASEEAIYGPAQWDPCGIDAGTDDGRPDRGETITLGFDGSKSGDSTALVAIRVSDNCAFTLGLWEPPEYDNGDWEVDRRSVDSAVHQAFAEYDVVGFFCDVSLWESYIDSWAELYGAKVLINGPSAKNPFYFDMRGAGMRVPQAHERLVQTIYDGRLKHNKDPRLRRHVLNAHRAYNNYGMTFRKESPDSSRKVDAYAALMLAHEAAAQFRITGKQRKVSTGMGYFL